jgi:predicted Zn-dependent protease
MNITSHQINDWVLGLPWSRFWRSLAALGAGVLATVILIVGPVTKSQRSELQRNYRQIALHAMVARNYEVARIACLRGLSFKNEADRLQWLFYLSVAMNGLGKSHEAAALLLAAAPLDQPGYDQAQMFMAQGLLGSTNVTPEIIHLAERHLKNALTANPNSPEINEMLGRLYINTRQFDLARQRLKAADPDKSNVALLLAITYREDHDSSAEKSWLNIAIESFKKDLEDGESENNAANRAGLLQALMMESNYADALKLLEKNSSAANNRGRWHAAIAEIYAAWAAEVANDPQGDLKECLELIEKGMDYAPENLKLRMMLIQISHLPGDGGLAARDAITKLMAKAGDESAAWWHLLLATDARRAGNNADVRRQLEAAYQLAPENANIANDMAMDLAFNQPEDLTRALTAIQGVIEKFPEDPNFRDTRGLILAKLGHNEAAADDLEFAAAKLPNSKEARMALVNVYNAMGKTQMAEAERRLVEMNLRHE